MWKIKFEEPFNTRSGIFFLRNLLINWDKLFIAFLSCHLYLKKIPPHIWNFIPIYSPKRLKKKICSISFRSLKKVKYYRKSWFFVLFYYFVSFFHSIRVYVSFYAFTTYVSMHNEYSFALLKTIYKKIISYNLFSFNIRDFFTFFHLKFF